MAIRKEDEYGVESSMCVVDLQRVDQIASTRIAERAIAAPIDLERDDTVRTEFPRQPTNVAF